jgi:hypothetical protein
MKAKHSRAGYMIKLLNPNKGTVRGASDPSGCDHIAVGDTSTNRPIHLYLTASSPQTLDSLTVLVQNYNQQYI